jgi:hypothetical protein
MPPDRAAQRARLHRLAQTFQGTPYPVERLPFFHEEVDAGEEYLALECLCDNLNDFDVPLTPATYAEIASLGTLLGIDERRWRMLERLVSPPDGFRDPAGGLP